MKKKKTWKTPNANKINSNGFAIKVYNSYNEYLEGKIAEGIANGATQHQPGSYNGEDDADRAARWVLENLKCDVNNGAYKMLYNGSEMSETDLVDVVKNDSDLKFAQKCWVIELLYGFNEAWMFNGPQDFKQYFRPLNCGQFGYDCRQDVMDMFR